MKIGLRPALCAAFIAATAASTHAATYTGDLILGFTSQSGNDFMYDLGQASSLTDGHSVNLGSQLSGFNLSTVQWGIVGDANIGGTRTAWTTTAGGAPAALANNAAWANLDTPTKSIFQNFAAGGAGQTLTISSTDDNSWNQQMINGALTTQYHNAYANPNQTGLGSLSIWTVVANGSSPSLLGTFSLDAGGNVSFSAAPVPEPSTFALLGLFGVAALSLRRTFNRQS